MGYMAEGFFFEIFFEVFIPSAHSLPGRASEGFLHGFIANLTLQNSTSAL